MTKRLLLTASVFGFLCVAFGAMGAHKLKELISATNLEIFEKGVRYQFYHTIAILLVALLHEQFKRKQFYYAGMLFSAGIVCFSGSLYLLAMRDLLGLNSTNIIGPITPIGGMFFLAGWIMLFVGVQKSDFKKG